MYVFSFIRVIRLENGLTACLISDSSSAPALDNENDNEEESAEETGSEMESESEGHESTNTGDDEDDSMPKRVHPEEQKMVTYNSFLSSAIFEGFILFL